MHTHLPEVVAKSLLEESVLGIWQGLFATFQGVYPFLSIRCDLGYLARNSLCLNKLHLLFFLNLTLNQGSNPIGLWLWLDGVFLDLRTGSSLSSRYRLELWRRHTHHFISHPVRLLLINIVGCTDGQFSV